MGRVDETIILFYSLARRENYLYTLKKVVIDVGAR